MDELFDTLTENELKDLIYDWWSFYRLSPISLELDDEFKKLMSLYPKEILTCAACLHKDFLPNENLVNAIAEGYSEFFLKGVAISVGLFFSSQEELDEELKLLVDEVRGIKGVKKNYCYLYYEDELGNKVLS